MENNFLLYFSPLRSLLHGAGLSFARHVVLSEG